MITIVFQGKGIPAKITKGIIHLQAVDPGGIIICVAWIFPFGYNLTSNILGYSSFSPFVFNVKILQ